MNKQIIRYLLHDDLMMLIPILIFLAFIITLLIFNLRKTDGLFNKITQFIILAISVTLASMQIFNLAYPAYDYLTKSYYSGIGYVSEYTISKEGDYIVINGSELRISDDLARRNEFVGKIVTYTCGENSSYIVSIEEKK